MWFVTVLGAHGGVASQALSIYCHLMQFYVLYRMFFGNLFLTRYHRHTYFRMRQIFALFAICSQFSKICTRKIFVGRVYSRFGTWTFSLLVVCNSYNMDTRALAHLLHKGAKRPRAINDLSA